MKKVTTIVLNTFTNDSRVLKENISLKKAGYDVKILALYKDGLAEHEIVEEIPVYRINVKSKMNKKNNISKSENIDTDEENKNSLALDELPIKDIKTKDLIKLLLHRLYKIFMVKTYLYKLLRGLKRIKNRVLNKYFKLYRIKFNILFAKEAKDSDIIHCNDLLTLPMGVIVKKFYNKDVKIVYDAHEHETETNGLKGRKKIFRKILERSLIKYADRVITVSDSIANDYVRLYNIEKPSLVLNTPPYKEIEKKDIFREKFNISKDKTIFLYQGSLAKGRGIEDLLESFRDLRDTNTNSVIVFMGYGYYEKEIKRYAKEYHNIYFHPAVSPNVLLDYTSSADFGISMIEDICLSYRYALPNKMFEYIMAEVPVIVSNLPEMRKIVNEYKVGVVAKSNDIKGLEEAIIEATHLNKDKLSKNIQEAKKIFNWENQEKVLLDVYKSL